MRGDFDMIRTVLALTVFCGIVLGSVEHGAVVPVFPGASQALHLPPPVVAAASSQYFERTFNRLVIPPVLEPVVPVAPAPPVVRVAPAPPIFVQPTNVVPAAPTQPQDTVQPNVAIAVATAHAAAPVATFLLPPYPFGAPPTIGFIPPSPPINVPDDSRKESTTKSTTTTKVAATTQAPEESTSSPQPSNSDNNFVQQALPSNENVNFRFYGPPLPPQKKPQKLKTSVEIVPVPLTYITPPPLPKFQAIKTIKHIHTFVPTKTKVIIRPVRLVSPVKIRTLRVPSRLVYRKPLIDRISAPSRSPVGREVEPITFRPSIRPFTKPPRV